MRRPPSPKGRGGRARIGARPPGGEQAEAVATAVAMRSSCAREPAMGLSGSPRNPVNKKKKGDSVGASIAEDRAVKGEKKKKKKGGGGAEL